MINNFISQIEMQNFANRLYKQYLHMAMANNCAQS